ncbi:MAG TPA: hypothetical protein VF772_28085, partial [Terriglobales bacterium]
SRRIPVSKVLDFVTRDWSYAKSYWLDSRRNFPTKVDTHSDHGDVFDRLQHLYQTISSGSVCRGHCPSRPTAARPRHV